MNEIVFKFEALKGVGNVELTLQADQRVYTFIGTNGVGKTKCLEALLQFHLFETTQQQLSGNLLPSIANQLQRTIDDVDTVIKAVNRPAGFENALIFNGYSNIKPLVFIGVKSRGFIHDISLDQFGQAQNFRAISVLGSFADRRKKYIDHLLSKAASLSPSNVDYKIDGIEEWIIKIAKSSNKFQTNEDNREIELKTLLYCLHEIDQRFNSSIDNLKITGDERVKIIIDSEEKFLSSLSSGFSSLVALIQSIVSGYGAMTNADNLANVAGTVIIDEIESHLHNEWQVKIIPLLKKLFPHTTFFIATHSALVLSQLQEGEAYRLQREEDGVVRSKLIQRPNKAILADLLDDAFDVDVNALKITNSSPDDQSAFRTRLIYALDIAMKKVEEAKP